MFWYGVVFGFIIGAVAAAVAIAAWVLHLVTDESLWQEDAEEEPC